MTATTSVPFLLLLCSAAVTFGQGFECPADTNGQFPDTENCRIFYTCSNGIKYTQRCAGGSFYDGQKHECVDRRIKGGVKCGPQPVFANHPIARTTPAPTLALTPFPTTTPPLSPAPTPGTCGPTPTLSDSFLVTVKTGDEFDERSNSSVHIVLEDQYVRCTTQIPIIHPSKGHPKRGGTEEFRIPISKGFDRIAALKIVIDNTRGVTQDWKCVNKLTVDQRIEHNQNYDTSMPQLEPSNINPILIEKRKEYQFTYCLTAAMVKDLPKEEYFSVAYAAKFSVEYALSKFYQIALRLDWEYTKNINSIYGGKFPRPMSIENWKKDLWFGAQRVQGTLPNIIKLCSKIPDKLGVTAETVNGLLEGSTLQQALENKRIFITDLDILDGIEYKDKIDHASPIALFYLNKGNHLMPIAIQLLQMKGSNNPIYTPKDPPNTWLVAKMFYNNAEAQLHEIVHHFCYTHLIMDGFATSMNRQLAPSHPIYQLLKPFFLYLLAINNIAKDVIFSPGGDLDLFSIGTSGTKQLNAKAVPLFNFERAIGSVESDARAREVWNKTVLPYYPFRDDAASIYKIIKEYVTTIVLHYYDSPEKVRGDQELKNYRVSLSRSRDKKGVGIPGLPGNDSSGFSNVSEVIDMVTMIITQSSVGHAAVNFPQYDTYGYVANYPAYLKQAPPFKKVNYTEDDIMSLLPDKKDYLGIMGITSVLSWHGTDELGDFEKTYLSDPVSLQAHRVLRTSLRTFSHTVGLRNRNRLFSYEYLDPDFVPNATSI